MSFRGHIIYIFFIHFNFIWFFGTFFNVKNYQKLAKSSTYISTSCYTPKDFRVFIREKLMLIYCDLLIFSIVSQSTNRDSTIWHESSLNRIDFSLHELMQREVSWYSLENSCMNKCPIRIGFFQHEQMPRVYLCNPFENICNSIKKEADNT